MFRSEKSLKILEEHSPREMKSIGSVKNLDTFSIPKLRTTSVIWTCTVGRQSPVKMRTHAWRQDLSQPIAPTRHLSASSPDHASQTLRLCTVLSPHIVLRHMSNHGGERCLHIIARFLTRRSGSLWQTHPYHLHCGVSDEAVRDDFPLLRRWCSELEP